MADTKVSAMTNASALAGGEEFHVVQSTNDRAASIDQVKTYVTTTPLAVVGNATAGAELRLPEDTDNGSNYVAIKAPDNLAATYTLTLPADDGSADQYLKTDGSGGLSWASVSGASAPLTLAGGTVTDPSTPLTITQTWNDAADTFVGVDIAITNTASAAASRVFRATVGANTVFGVRTDGSYGGFNNSLWFETYGGGGVGVIDAVLGTTTLCRLFDSAHVSGVSAVWNYGFGYSSTGSVSSNYLDVMTWASAPGILNLRGGNKTTGAALNLLEQTAPSAPSTNEVVIYAEDNGSGKTRLMARFATGAAQVLATEP